MRLHDFLDFRARERPDSVFAELGDRSMSYGEAVAEVNRLANAFVGAGLQAGDRVALLSKNSIEYAIMFFAASKAGVVNVPLNYRLNPAEWPFIINDCQAKTLFASNEYVPAMDAARPELKNIERFIAIGASEPDGWEDYQKFIAGQDSSPPDRVITEEHDVYQMYTSGTTGRPKGAVLTQGAVTTNMVQIFTALEGKTYERYLIVAPMYHAAAAITTFNCIYAGGTLHIQEDYNPVDVVRALSEEKIGLTLLVPAMIQACLVFVPDIAERNYDDLRLMVYGASPIAEETLKRAMDVFKCDFAQGYGMTETTAVLSFLLPEDHQRAVAGKEGLFLSAGRPLPGTDVRVVDEDDNPVPSGTIGEIVGRGSQLMSGYWNLPEE